MRPVVLAVDTTAGVLAEIGAREVCVIGSGARNALLNRLIAEASGLPVHAGSVDATALGNASGQGIALGVFADLDDARPQLRGRLRR